MKNTRALAGALRPFPSPVDDAILRAAHTYHLLSLRQLARILHYSPRSLTYVQERVKPLADAGYLLRHFLPKPSPLGKAPTIYSLGPKGQRHLMTLGVPVAERLRRSEAPHSYLFYMHTLQVNDFLIAATEVARHHPGIHLEAVIHDRVLQRSPVSVTLTGGTTMTVIPDGWLDFRIRDATGRFQACLVLELDRGTEGKERYKRKLAGLLAYAQGPYQAAFGTQALSIAFVTTADASRYRDLLAWTEAQLTQQEAKSLAELFFFTDRSFGDDDSHRHFITRCWHQPFGERPVALLPVGEVYP